jgi:hypothetical protein
VSISSGSIGNRFSAYLDSVVNIRGGTIGDNFYVSNSEVNISGGTIGEPFTARFKSDVNLLGSNFVLDGVLLDDSLTIDDAFTIYDRDVILSGLLSAGSAFSFDLHDFDASVMLTVTLVSQTGALLGDCNLDGAVNFLDISPFISILSAGGLQIEADCDQNGFVNFLDISPFIAILSGSGS